MRQRQRWSELPLRQRILTTVLGAVQVALLAAALIDIWRRPQYAVRGPKSLWTALSFINLAGPIAYFAFGRKRD